MRILRLFRTTIWPAIQALLILALVLAPMGVGLVWVLRVSGREGQVADHLKKLPSEVGHGVAEAVVDGTDQLVEDLTEQVKSMVSDAANVVREIVLESGTGLADVRTPASPPAAGEQDGMNSGHEALFSQDDYASSVAQSPSDVTIRTGGEWATEQEKHTLDEINRIRQEHGLKPLRWDNTLAEIAWSRASEILETQYVSSSHYLKRSGAPEDAAVAAGLTESGIAETLAFEVDSNITTRTVTAASAWYNSPPHRTIMLDPQLELVGVGVAFTDRPLRVYRDGEPRDLTAVVSAVYRMPTACIPGVRGCPDDPAAYRDSPTGRLPPPGLPPDMAAEWAEKLGVGGEAPIYEEPLVSSDEAER